MIRSAKEQSRSEWNAIGGFWGGAGSLPTAIGTFPKRSGSECNAIGSVRKRSFGLPNRSFRDRRDVGHE